MAMVTATAANDLAGEKGNLSPFDNRKNADILFPLNAFPSTIVHRYSREEIRDKIKKAFEKNNIKNVDFEFAITTTSMIGDDLQSKNYAEAYMDTIHNLCFRVSHTNLQMQVLPKDLLRRNCCNCCSSCK